MAPKFNMNKNPVYQVEFSVQSSGKKVSLTKRRVRWVFGYSNADAIASGATGVDCRGEEHEVVLIWSLASSKRTLRIDGEEIHYSVGRFSDTKFQFSYPIRGGHLLKVIAHFIQPIMSKPEFRQFDLQLDGLSFFDMPRVFQLGQTSPMKIPHYLSEFKGSSQSEIRPYSNYKLEDSNEFAHPRVIVDSSSKSSHAATPIDLFSFTSVNTQMDPAVTAPKISQSAAAVAETIGSTQAFKPFVNPVSNDMTVTRSNSGSVNSRSSQIYAPVPQHSGNMISYDDLVRNRSSSYSESIKTKSSYDDIRTMILDSYELSSPPSLAFSDDLTRSQDSSSLSFSSSYREDSPTQEMKHEERPGSACVSANLENAFHTLVNLNLVSKPVTVATKPEPTMSLNELKQSSASRSSMQHPSKEIMKPASTNMNHATGSYGAMVPYGYNNYMVNPPPLLKVSGFGIGATHVHDSRFENTYALNN